MASGRGGIRPRLLSIAPWVPSAAAPYAGHQFYHRYLTRLSDTFEVQLLATDTGPNRNAISPADPWEVQLLPPRPGGWLQRRLGRPGRELAALTIQGRGIAVPSLASLPEGDSFRPQVVELFWAETLPLVPGIRRRFPASYLAAFQIDLYSEILRWPKLGDLRLRQRARDTMAGRVIAHQERSLLGRCDLVLTFRSSDVPLLRRRGLMVPISVLDPWLEAPAPRRPSEEHKDVLFVAAFNRRENRLGALWLLDNVWPRVLAEHPAARLVLAGSGPGEELLRRQGPSVVVTGFVDDLGPYYRSAHCAVAPIFSGGGLRFKVPQALSYGIPVVATPEALAGLEERPPGCIAGTTEDPEAFAAAISWALGEPEQAAVGARLAQQWVAERFSFDASLAQVRDQYLAHVRAVAQALALRKPSS